MPELDLDDFWEARGEKSFPFASAVPNFLEHQVRQQEWLSGLIGRYNPKCLLDFGCGDGAMFKCWSGVRDVFAYDRSATMRHRARVRSRQEGGRVKFTIPGCANRALVPYHDNTFDFIAMVAVVAHVTPKDLAVLSKEMERISKNGAVWAIVTSAPFNDSKLGYMWDHNYESDFFDDVKVIDDHAVGPYRYVEAVYVGGDTLSKEGGIKVIQGDSPLQRPNGVPEVSSPPVVEEVVASRP